KEGEEPGRKKAGEEEKERESWDGLSGHRTGVRDGPAMGFAVAQPILREKTKRGTRARKRAAGTMEHMRDGRVGWARARASSGYARSDRRSHGACRRGVGCSRARRG